MKEKSKLQTRENPNKPGKKQYRAPFTYYELLLSGEKKRHHGFTGWCETPAQARDAAKKREESGKPERKVNGVSIDDVMEHYRKMKESEVDRSSRTHISRFNVISKTFRHVLGDADLNRLEGKHFREYSNYLFYEYKGSGIKQARQPDSENGRISYKYYTNIRATFYAILRHGIQFFYLPSDIVQVAQKNMDVKQGKTVYTMKEPWKTPIPGKHRYLTSVEFKKVLKHLWESQIAPNFDPTMLSRSYVQYVLYKVIFYTSLRWEEARALTLADVKRNENKNVPYVKYQRIEVNKAVNERQYGEETKELKTEGAYRFIEIINELHPTIDDYCDYIRSLYKNMGIEDEAEMLLFPNPNGWGMLNSKRVNKILHAACMETLGFYITVYGLRHSAAMYYIDEVGLSLEATKVIFGHSEDSKMLEEVYALYCLALLLNTAVYSTSPETVLTSGVHPANVYVY